MRKLHTFGVLLFIGLIPKTFSRDASPKATTCDGTSSFWNIGRCCRKNGPCDVGEGHCRSDDECADGLQCGRRNCKKDFSDDNTWWSRGHNCCFGKKS